MAAEADPALLAAFAERLVALRKRTGFPQPKSGKPRTVPLTLRLAEALRAAAKLGGDWVYPAARSAGPCPYNTLLLRLRRVCHEAGVTQPP